MSTQSLIIRGLAAALLMLSLAAPATEPAAGTLSDTSGPLSFTSGPNLQSNPSAQVELQCDDTTPCDDYALTVDTSATFQNANPDAIFRVSVSWPNPAEDYDIYLLDANGGEIASAATSSNPEIFEYKATPGSYTIRVVPFTVAGGTAEATIELVVPEGGGASEQMPPTGLPPRFFYFQSPDGLADGAGEPTIGYNPKTGRAMFIAGLETDRITFAENTDTRDAAGNPLPESCLPTWENKSYVGAVNTLDPILETEQSVGRTFASQLSGANSLFAYSDDDGQTWTPGQAGPPEGGYDHQTVGTGPWPVGGKPPTATVDYAIYYCSQSSAAAFCSRSDDGGRTFGPGVPFTDQTVCTGTGAIHGHVQVAPDGTVYVPNRICNGAQAVTVSEDAGLTWKQIKVPGTLPAQKDPAVGVASDGTVYFCYEAPDHSAHVTVSKDKGETWSKDYNISAAVNIATARFVTAVAGDPDRAACAFIGTETAGNSEANDFPGFWYGYVATTYDGGDSWHTVNVTPGDPLQGAGGVCVSGATCMGNNRNLLDFNDIITDETGRLMFGFADGCIGACVQDPTKNSFTDDGVLVRQSGGRGLRAAFDAAEPAAPGGACLLPSSLRTTAGATLEWREADSGGVAIGDYRILRGIAPDAVDTEVGRISGKTRFVDTSADPNVGTYYYRIAAVNPVGETGGNVVALPVMAAPIPEDSCTLPGITIATGAAGDCSTNGCTPQTDLVSAGIAELPGAPDKITVRITVDSLDPAPAPGSYWYFLTSDQDGNPLYLSMDTAGGTPAYTYGSYAAGAAGVLTFSPAGALDEASTNTTDGNIYLVADRSLFGGLAPGDVVSPIDIRTRSGASSAPSRDTMAGGGYTVLGTDACGAAGVPTAVLAADPSAGAPPLTVTFTVSGGVAAPGDSLQSYTLDFGDGSSMDNQPFGDSSSVVLSHDYTEKGFYSARLSVVDSNGTPSENRAERVISVAPPQGGGGSTPPSNPPPGPQPTPDTGAARSSGGSLALWTLLPLLGLGLRRRRRDGAVN